MLPPHEKLGGVGVLGAVGVVPSEGDGAGAVERHVRLDGLPPEQDPEQQSPPSLQDSPTLANEQTIGALVVGELVGVAVVGEEDG